jgi:hypothetical protein
MPFLSAIFERKKTYRCNKLACGGAFGKGKGDQDCCPFCHDVVSEFGARI